MVAVFLLNSVSPGFWDMRHRTRTPLPNQSPQWKAFYLCITQHDHAYQDHIHMYSKGLIMVNFIDLKTKDRGADRKASQKISWLTRHYRGQSWKLPQCSSQMTFLFLQIQFKLNSEVKSFILSFEVILKHVNYWFCKFHSNINTENVFQWGFTIPL